MDFFGTDGIRGLANVHPLTPEFAMRIVIAASKVLDPEREKGEKKLMTIGMDTRRSGHMLAYAAGAAAMSIGYDVLNLDVVPTAGLAYITKKQKAAFGIMISASHNPYYDNGIKIFSSEGFKLSEEAEALVERELFTETPERPTHGKIGVIKRNNEYIVDPVSDYAEYVSSLIEKSQSESRKKLKVVIDGANGAASNLVKKVFGDRFNVIAINCQPDGENINFNCGSTHIETLAKTVREERASCGIAFDGDADRALFIDEHGELIDGDQIIAMLACDMKNTQKLKNNVVVTTVMSNLGFIHSMKKEDINLITTMVGDRNVLSEMTARNGVIGGEQSGHVILLDKNTTGDGLITAVCVLNLMKRSEKKLSELARVMQKYPQVLINVKVAGDKNAYKTDPDVVRSIKSAEEKFLNRGRVLVRPSGTENLVRVMIEGEHKSEITSVAEEITNIIKRKMGA